MRINATIRNTLHNQMHTMPIGRRQSDCGNRSSLRNKTKNNERDAATSAMPSKPEHTGAISTWNCLVPSIRVAGSLTTSFATSRRTHSLAAKVRLLSGYHKVIDKATRKCYGHSNQ